MLAGIVFPLVSIIAYSFLAAESFLRRYTNKPIDFIPANPDVTRKRVSRDVKMMCGALAIVTLFLFTRSIYRTVELAGGWIGYILRTQIYFSEWSVYLLSFGIPCPTCTIAHG